ncbi:MAG: superoxide dismutase, Ni [Victivallaceae bacterium]|nr:superoxide dismutase, Ni [Victivallaceae bacterium]
MKQQMKKMLIASVVMLVMAGSSIIYAHCQVPCGIYDDNARVEAMLENAATVSKATKQINSLANKTDAQSQNQRVRWILNKEKHAQNIIMIIADYFLTQRVKPSQKDYPERLIKHHKVILLAMKVKQNVDLKYVKQLKVAIKALEAYYPEHKHDK